MPTCLENIVTLGICPDEAVSLSGYTLMSAAGMSSNNLANIATENYTNGIALALEKKRLAILRVQSDFIGQLALTGVQTRIANLKEQTSRFDPSISKGASLSARGVVIHKNLSWRGDIRQTKIKGVEIYPLNDGTGELIIKDGSNKIAWDIDLVGGQINYFDNSILNGLDYTILSDKASVVINAPDVSFASANIRCMKGCGNTLPNDCAWADGWDGSGYVRNEGFGLNVEFQCECDYTQILCSNPAIFGRLIWLAWQMEVYDEHYKSNRFNGFVLYNKDVVAEKILPQLESDYSIAFNNITGNLKTLLETFKDDCLSCQGIRWVTNI